MPDIAYLGLYFSGGTFNAGALFSLGGPRSTNGPPASPGPGNTNDNNRVIGQTGGASEQFCSVYHLFRFDPAETLRIIVEGREASPGSFQGIGVLRARSSDLAVDYGLTTVGIGEGGPGQGTIPFNDGSVVTVRRYLTANWPNPSASLYGSVSTNSEGMFDNVTSTDAWNGLVDYRMFYFTNLATNGLSPGTPGQRFNRAKLWIDVQPASAQIDIGFSPLEINTEPTAIADRFTAPAGITFVDYDSAENALEFDVIDGLTQIPLWFRRTVFPGQSAGDITDDFFDVVWEATG
jgi:hypothetical protein